MRTCQSKSHKFDTCQVVLTLTHQENDQDQERRCRQVEEGSAKLSHADVINEVEHGKGQHEQVHKRTKEEIKYLCREVRRDERCILPIFLQTNREVGQ